jgi:hypothetical protein
MQESWEMQGLQNFDQKTIRVETIWRHRWGILFEKDVEWINVAQTSDRKS